MGAAMGTFARGKHYNFRISQLSESAPDRERQSEPNRAKQSLTLENDNDVVARVRRRQIAPAE
jgi:hypothetical protein